MPEQQVSTGITMEQLQVILKAQAEQTREIVAAAVAAAKAPTADEAAEKAEKKARYEKSRQQAIQNQEAERKAKEQRQNNCTHKKENGKYATGGQIIGGRYGMILCQHCQRPWFAKFSQEVISQINAGDLSLAMIDPTSGGWMDAPPAEMVEAVVA